MKYLGEYEVLARYVPAFLTIIPLAALTFIVEGKYQDLQTLFGQIIAIKITANITVAFVVFYFWSQIIRATSKYFENKYFHRRDGFPSTYLVQYQSNVYSDSFKDKYRKKVNKLFDIKLLNKKEETKNSMEAKRLLNEATKQIILHVKDGQLVRKENISYGLMRNFIGGTPYAGLISFLGILFLWHRVSLGILLFFIFLAITYSLAFIFRKTLLTQTAETYAKQLLGEFMAHR